MSVSGITLISMLRFPIWVFSNWPFAGREYHLYASCSRTGNDTSTVSRDRKDPEAKLESFASLRKADFWRTPRSLKQAKLSTFCSPRQLVSAPFRCRRWSFRIQMWSQYRAAAEERTSWTKWPINYLFIGVDIKLKKISFCRLPRNAGDE